MTYKREEQAPANLQHRQGILKPEPARLQHGRVRTDSISSNVSWKDTTTPMFPHLQRNEKEKKPAKDDLKQVSFLVEMIEDLRGTQKKMEENIFALQQSIAMPAGNQSQQQLQQTYPAAVNPYQQPSLVPPPHLPNPNPWWTNTAPALPSFY